MVCARANTLVLPWVIPEVDLGRQVDALVKRGNDEWKVGTAEITVAKISRSNVVHTDAADDSEKMNGVLLIFCQNQLGLSALTVHVVDPPQHFKHGPQVLILLGQRALFGMEKKRF